MPKASSRIVFLAWLEIPYFIGVPYETVYPATYRPGIDVELGIRFRNDLLRVRTSNSWTNPDHREKQIREFLQEPKQPVFWVPRYVTEADLRGVAELVEKHNLPYLHVERPETVVELRAEFEAPSIMDETVAEVRTVGADYLPQPSFFSRHVLPRIAGAVDAYRVATLPAIRYSIHPVSESLVGTAFIQLQDEGGRIIQQVGYGFDVRSHNRSMQDHVEKLGIQSRFQAGLADPASIDVEAQLCSSYYLFHMRRWAEAVTIASGVVDHLLREAVFSKLGEPLGKLLWKAYRMRTKELFNQVLPALGFPKLAEIEKTLWGSFNEAKDYRGSKAHGSAAIAFDRDEEESVQRHMIALYSVARWLSLETGRPWALDVIVDGKPLPFF